VGSGTRGAAGYWQAAREQVSITVLTVGLIWAGGTRITCIFIYTFICSHRVRWQNSYWFRDFTDVLWCSPLSHHYICIVAVPHSHNGQFEVTIEFFFKMIQLIFLVLWDLSKQCILIIQRSQKAPPVDVQALLRVLWWKSRFKRRLGGCIPAKYSRRLPRPNWQSVKINNSLNFWAIKILSCRFVHITK
jgi:hypothetical protein